MPTEKQIQAWTTTHLEKAADAWGQRAGVLQKSYQAASSALDGLRWHGTASELARDRFRGDTVEVGRVADTLRQLADAALRGATQIAQARQAALEAIRNAESYLFNVSDDLKLTDRLPEKLRSLIPFREIFRRVLQMKVQGAAMHLWSTDESVAAALKAMGTAVRDFDFSRALSPEHTNAPGGPAITGPAGPLKYEQDKYDLQVAFPDGDGQTLGGDPQTHKEDWTPVGEPVPRDPDSELAEHPRGPDGKGDGTRTLPTGTAIGPNGEHLAFFSYPTGKEVDGKNPYAAPSEAWDYSDPNNPKPLGPMTFPGGSHWSVPTASRPIRITRGLLCKQLPRLPRRA